MPLTRGSKGTQIRQTRSQNSTPKQAPAAEKPAARSQSGGRTKSSSTAPDGKVSLRPQSSTGRQTRRSVNTDLSETIGKSTVGKPVVIATSADVQIRRSSRKSATSEGPLSKPSKEFVNTPETVNQVPVDSETAHKKHGKQEQNQSVVTATRTKTTAVTEATIPVNTERFVETENEDTPQQRGRKRGATVEYQSLGGRKKKMKTEDVDETEKEDSNKDSGIIENLQTEEKAGMQSSFSPRRSSRAVIPNSRFKDMEMLDVGGRKSEVHVKTEKRSSSYQKTPPASSKMDVSINFSKQRKSLEFDTSPVIKDTPNSSCIMTVFTDDSSEEMSTESSKEPPSPDTVEGVLVVPAITPSVVPQVITLASPTERGTQQSKPRSPVKVITPVLPDSVLGKAIPVQLSVNKPNPVSEILMQKGIAGKPGQKVIVLGPSRQSMEQGLVRVQTKKSVGSPSQTSLESKINIIPSKTILNVSNVGKGSRVRIISRPAASPVKHEKKTSTVAVTNNTRQDFKGQDSDMMEKMIEVPDKKETGVKNSSEIPMEVNTDLSQDTGELEVRTAAMANSVDSGVTPSVSSFETVQPSADVVAFPGEMESAEGSEETGTVISIPETSLLDVQVSRETVQPEITDKSSGGKDMAVSFPVEPEEVTVTDGSLNTSSSSSSHSHASVKQAFENRFCEVIQYGSKSEAQKSVELSSGEVEYVMFGDRLIPIHRPQGHAKGQQPGKKASPVKPGRVEIVVGNSAVKQVRPGMKQISLSEDNRVDSNQASDRKPEQLRSVEVLNLPTQPEVLPKSEELEQQTFSAEKSQESEGPCDSKVYTSEVDHSQSSETESGTTVTEVVDSKLMMEVSQLIDMVPNQNRLECKVMPQTDADDRSDKRSEGQEVESADQGEDPGLQKEDCGKEKEKSDTEEPMVISLSDVGEEEVYLDETTGEMFNQSGIKIKIPERLPSPVEKNPHHSIDSMADVTGDGTGVAEVTVDVTDSQSAKEDSDKAVNIQSTTPVSDLNVQKLKYETVGTKTVIHVYPDKSREIKSVMSSTSTQTPIQEEGDGEGPRSRSTAQTDELEDSQGSVEGSPEDRTKGKPQTQEFIIVHLPEGTDVKQRFVKHSIKHTDLLEEDVTMTSDGDFFCADCDYITPKKSNWFKHRRKHLGIKPHQCPQCDYRAATSSNLKRHIAIHEDIRNYLCSICQLTFRQKIHLERHIKYKHEEKKVQCPLCEYTCASENPDLKTHIKRRHMPQEDGTMSAFTCNECGLMTVSKRDLKQHMKFHKKGPELKLFCEFCSFVTDCESRLRRHMFIHTKEKPFQCGLCEYRATQKEHVLRHMRTQHNIEVSRTPRKVSSTAENQSDTSSSIDSDSEPKEKMFERADYSSTDKIFACNHCTMKFSKLINLYKHLYAQHRAVMPDPSGHEFQCVVCDFRTNNKKNLLVHMRKHNIQDQTPPSHVYSCVLCRYINPRRRNLFQHMKKKHGIEIMMKEDGSTNCYLADNTPVVLGREEGDTNVMSLADIVTTTALDDDSQLQIVTDDVGNNAIPISNIISVEDVTYMNSTQTDTPVISSAPTQTQIIYPSLAEHEAAEAIEGLQALAQQAGLLESQALESEMTDTQVMVENSETTAQETSNITADSHILLSSQDDQLADGNILKSQEVMIEGEVTPVSSTGGTVTVGEVTTAEVLSAEIGAGEILEEVVTADDINVPAVKVEEEQSIQLSTDQINQLSSGDFVEINGEVYKVEISSEDGK